MIDLYTSIYSNVTTEFVSLLADRDSLQVESFPLPSHPVVSGSRGSSVDKFSPFFLFLSFVISLNKPLIVPNEKGGYSFYVLVINLEQQENDINVLYS